MQVHMYRSKIYKISPSLPLSPPPSPPPPSPSPPPHLSPPSLLTFTPPHLLLLRNRHVLWQLSVDCSCLFPEAYCSVCLLLSWEEMAEEMTRVRRLRPKAPGVCCLFRTGCPVYGHWYCFFLCLLVLLFFLWGPLLGLSPSHHPFLVPSASYTSSTPAPQLHTYTAYTPIPTLQCDVVLAVIDSLIPHPLPSSHHPPSPSI